MGGCRRGRGLPRKNRVETPPSRPSAGPGGPPGPPKNESAILASIPGVLKAEDNVCSPPAVPTDCPSVRSASNRMQWRVALIERGAGVGCPNP